MSKSLQRSVVFNILYILTLLSNNIILNIIYVCTQGAQSSTSLFKPQVSSYSYIYMFEYKGVCLHRQPINDCLSLMQFY